MNKLTLALQNEMNITIEGKNIVIEIPKECNRDLWKGQISYWLENEFDELTESGNLRITNKNNLSKDKYKK